MTTVEDIIDFCQKNDLLCEVSYDRVSCGGHKVSNVDMTAFRVDQRKPVVTDVYYPQYELRFNSKSREVVFQDFSGSEKKFDIRNHPAWGK